MPAIVTETGGGDFKKVPQGTHLAVCDAVVMLGRQETNFGAKEQVYLRFQIPAERIEIDRDGKKLDLPMSIGKTYTASLNEKATLRAHLENWRGRSFTEAELKAFDLFNILGKPCQVTVVHKESGPKVYANVTSISALPKGVPAPTLEGDTIRYSDDEQGQYDDLPEWIQKKLAEAVDEHADPMAHSEKPPASSYDDDSDIPF